MGVPSRRRHARPRTYYDYTYYALLTYGEVYLLAVGTLDLNVRLGHACLVRVRVRVRVQMRVRAQVQVIVRVRIRG